MKKIRLYNMILPPFMLFFVMPSLWVVSFFGNFLIDSLVILILSLFIYKKLTFQLYKKSIVKVFLFGFLSDFIGVFYLLLVSVFVDANYYEGPNVWKQILSGIYLATSHSCYDSPYGVAFIMSGIFISGLLIFILNYFISFNTFNTYLTKQQRLFSAITLALLTAPYTLLLPKELFY